MLSLHLGPYKTGTTTVQVVLSAAAPRLRAFGIDYNPVVSDRMDQLPLGDDSWVAHHQLAFPFIESPRALLSQDEVRAWFTAVGRKRGVTLISSEAFWSLDPPVLESLLRLGDCEVRIVAVFRCVVEMALSAWHTAVGEGFTGTHQQYVSDVVLETRRDFDYEFHLAPLAQSWEVTVVDYQGTSAPVVRRVIDALHLPTDAFPSSSLEVRENQRPPAWFTALLRAIHAGSELDDFNAHERAAVSRALRGVAALVEPTSELTRRAVDDESISAELIERLRELCSRNRRTAQQFSPATLRACCGGSS